MPKSPSMPSRPSKRPAAAAVAQDASVFVLDDWQGARGDTLADQAYQKLRHALMTGALLPEQVLTVRGVAEDFGVSLTPVREAVQRLVVEHGLEVVNGRTIRVPRLGVETYREILKIRMELECLAAKEAAPRISHDEIERLEAVMQAHLAAIQAGDAHQTLMRNSDFHLSIYRASGQPILIRIIESLWLRVGPTLNLLFPRVLRQPDRPRDPSGRHGRAAAARRRRPRASHARRPGARLPLPDSPAQTLRFAPWAGFGAF